MKQAAKWVVLGALFIIPFLPLFVSNSLFFPFITGKGFAFRILVEIALGAYAVLAFADKRYRPRFSWVLALYSAFVVWMLIADLLGVNPFKAIWSNFERMEGWITLIHVFAFFLITGAVFSADKLWRKWWLTFIGASALVCAYSLLQLGGALAIHQGGRVDSTFGNAAYLAAYLLFAAAVTIWHALESKGWLRYVLGVLAAVQIIITFFTATRGAVIGLVVAAVVAAFLWAFESKGKARKIGIGALIGLVVIVGGFFMLRNTPFVQSEPTLQRIASIGPSDLSVRFALWHMALEGVAERPITGWGQEGFNYIFNKYYDPSLYAQEPWFDRAHNVFFDWLVAGGVPGLLLFLAAFAFALVALYRGGASKEERILLVAALVAYGVQGLVVFDNLFTYIPLAAILAMAHSVASRPIKKLDAMAEPSEETLQVAFPIGIVVALVLVWFVNVPNIAAASELVHAIGITGTDITPNVVLFQQALAQPTFGLQEVREQLMVFTGNIASQQTGTSSALSQLESFSLTEMGKQVALQPGDARLRLEYALGYRAEGDYPDALKQIQAAQQESPRKQSILLEEGITYWQMGNFADAQKVFDQAYDLDHAFPDVLTYAAAGDIAAGDVAGGKARLMSGIGTTTVDSEPLILAYYQAKDFPDLILCLKEQVKDQNNSIQSLFRLAAGYAAAGDIAGARATVSQITAAHPEAAEQAAQFLQHLPQTP